MMDASLRGLNDSLSAEDAKSRKIRKPYVISKSRETWTDMEHDRFIEALHLFDRDWKKIEAFVGSKTVIQIRSHAQKYFLKVQQNGMSEHVPPPRPKRKAAHPYPQKAPKLARMDYKFVGSIQPPAPLVQPLLPISNTMPSSSMHFYSRPRSSATRVNMSHIPQDGVAILGATCTRNIGCSSSNEKSSGTWCASANSEQGNASLSVRVMPDFAQVYNFIGSMFDPNSSGHLQKLKYMDPINVDTASLLMRNLAVNLTSPKFEEHRQLLASYDVKNMTFDCKCAGMHQNPIST